MRTISECVAADPTDPGFVRIAQLGVVAGNDLGGQIWFERANLIWVVSTLRACLAGDGFREARLTSGKDNLRVFKSGTEQQPGINLFNVRPHDAIHSGGYARTMSRRVADAVADRLAAIGA